MQRREAGIEHVGIGALLEQEERERHVASHRRDEQRRAALRRSSPDIRDLAGAPPC